MIGMHAGECVIQPTSFITHMQHITSVLWLNHKEESYVKKRNAAKASCFFDATQPIAGRDGMSGQ